MNKELSYGQQHVHASTTFAKLESGPHRLSADTSHSYSVNMCNENLSWNQCHLVPIPIVPKQLYLSRRNTTLVRTPEPTGGMPHSDFGVDLKWRDSQACSTLYSLKGQRNNFELQFYVICASVLILQA